MAAAIACAAATPAFAQSPARLPSDARREGVTTPVRAPETAFELGVGLGYTQGFGSLTSDPRVGAGPGGTVGVSLGYRIDPRWSVAWGGQYQQYGARGPAAPTLRGANVDVRGTIHLAPYDRVDPYISLGAGYRLFAESPGGDAPTTLTHGIELGKIEVGLDLRASESVAVSPVLGVDLNVFPWRTGGGPATAAPNPRSPSAFLFAGVEGRWDVGGARVNRPVPEQP
jgi:hypothetical protein